MRQSLNRKSSFYKSFRDIEGSFRNLDKQEYYSTTDRTKPSTNLSKTEPTQSQKVLRIKFDSDSVVNAQKIKQCFAEVNTIHLLFKRYDDDYFYAFSAILSEIINQNIDVELQLFFRHFNSEVFS